MGLSTMDVPVLPSTLVERFRLIFCYLGIPFFTTETQRSQRKEEQISSLCFLCLCGEIIINSPEGR